jgi:ethanolamine transporter EutH
MVRERIARELLTPLAAQLGADEPALRASLVAAQMVGLVMARHVVAVEPLASLPAERLADAIAPVLQRYLTEPL